MTPTQRSFLDELDSMIAARRKMTSPLYQRILAGDASHELLSAFIVHRYPIKAHWTRNILGIASRLDDYQLRCELVENIYEEETGALTASKRHLDTFVDVGLALGLRRAQIVDAGGVLPETRAVIDHNVAACNDPSHHFTEGVASVLLLMEGQPPIVSGGGASMLAVMRDVYRLPRAALTFFEHHASATDDFVSELEDDHATTARLILDRYCSTDDLRARARNALETALDLRHRHFDAVLRHAPGGVPYRHVG